VRCINCNFAPDTGGVHLFGGCGIPPPLVPRDAVGVHGLAGTSPDAISTLHRVKASTLRRLAERRKGELLVHERGQRYQASWSGDVGHDEPEALVDACPARAASACHDNLPISTASGP
jgi:hypothetical protein